MHGTQTILYRATLLESKLNPISRIRQRAQMLLEVIPQFQNTYLAQIVAVNSFWSNAEYFGILISTSYLGTTKRKNNLN